MPPLPTSLSVVALVVAWLVVLVPMAARRREHVPHSDERSAGFRVLRRRSSRRKRRVLSRTAVASRDDVDNPNAGVDSMDDQALWDDDLIEEEPPPMQAGRRTSARAPGVDRDRSRLARDADVPDDAEESSAASDGADRAADGGREEAAEGAEGAGGDDLAEELFDVEDDLDDLDDLEEDEPEEDERDDVGAVGDVPVSAGRRDPVGDEDRGDGAGGDDDGLDGVLDDLDPAPQRATARGGSEWQVPADWDAADEWAAEHRRAAKRRIAPQADTARNDAPEASDDVDEYHDDIGYDEDADYDEPVAPTGRGRATTGIRDGADDRRSDPGLSGDPGRTAPEPVGASASAASTGPAVGTGRAAQADLDDEVDEADLRPVPRRHGRGGFDPDAAAKAKAYRYRRRRRVSVFLLLATVVFVLLSVFVARAAWIGAAVCGALLVLYLAYLRRQVRIEESIRQRRAARLARARQIRPEYQRQPMPAGQAGGDAAPAMTATGRVGVPPVAYRSGTAVDLDDDDPAFSDLEYHRPVTYRRASGQ